MNKRQYCESRESIAYYSGLNGLEIKALNTALTIMFIVCRVVGMAGKLHSVFTAVKSTTP